MKLFKLLVILIVVALMLPSVGFAARGTPVSDPFVSDWIVIQPDQCGTVAHGLSYIPFDVHSWVNLYLKTQTYADVANYDGLELFTSPVYLMVCNNTSDTVEVKFSAQ